MLNVQSGSYASNVLTVQDGVTGSLPTYPSAGGYAIIPALSVASSETVASRLLWLGYKNGTTWDAFITAGACASFSYMCFDLGVGSTTYTALSNEGTTLYIGGDTFNTSNVDGTFTNVVFGNSGNVGIGVVSPSRPLTVYNTTGLSGGQMRMGYSDSYYWELGRENLSTGRLMFINNNNGSVNEYMSVLQNGNVGIGTASPSYTLHVNGSVAGTSAYTNLSDARLKTDVVEITGGLDSIQRLRPIHFHWKKPSERNVGKGLNLPVEEAQVGFLAQEVEPVVPEAVVKDPAGIYSMEETKLIPVLVEALKELKSKDEKMSAEFALMKAELKELKAAQSPARH